MRSTIPGEPAGQPPHIPDHELLRRIGRGSYGEVWLARNVMGTLRAVKVVRRAGFDHERPYEREYAGIQKFEPVSRSHEGFVDILQVGRNDAEGYFYYVMELADDAGGNPKPEIRDPKEIRSPKPETSAAAAPALRPSDFGPPSDFGIRNSDLYAPRTLRSEIQHRGRLPVDECLALGLSLARALAHLHTQGLVHRDVKPSNIIFVGGVPKLADIGLVADVGEARSYVGTAGFIPPEGPGTPAADLYSLGKVLYEASTGKDRQDFPEPLTNLGDQPDKDRLIELNAVLHKACATDPRERYRSAEEMHADLALLERGQSLKRRRIIRRRFVVGAKVLVASLVLTMVVTGGKLWRNATNSATRQTLAAGGQKAENPEVTKLCKLGRFHFYKITEKGYAQAMECFNKALEIDPDSVEALACMADLCVVSQPSKFLPPKAAEAKMRWVRERLMALDSRLAEGHAVQGYINLVYDWKPGEAEKELRLALELDPDLLIAHIWRARLLVYTRKFGEAEQEYKKAQQLDPTRYGLNVNAGCVPFFARRYDRAIQNFENAIEVLPDQNWAMHMIGRANEEKGDFPAAIVAFQKAELASVDQPQLVKPDVVTNKYVELREAYERAGQEGYWRKKLEFAQRESGRWMAWAEAWEVAQFYAHLDDADAAFEWLGKAFEERSELLLWLSVDPGWDRIRSDSRFVALLNRMRLTK